MLQGFGFFLLSPFPLLVMQLSLFTGCTHKTQSLPRWGAVMGELHNLQDSRNLSLDAVSGNGLTSFFCSSARQTQKYNTALHPWEGKTGLSNSFGLWI